MSACLERELRRLLESRGAEVLCEGGSYLVRTVTHEDEHAGTIGLVVVDLGELARELEDHVIDRNRPGIGFNLSDRERSSEEERMMELRRRSRRMSKNRSPSLPRVKFLEEKSDDEKE